MICKKHRNYRAIHAPRSGCKMCKDIYEAKNMLICWTVLDKRDLTIMLNMIDLAIDGSLLEVQDIVDKINQ